LKTWDGEATFRYGPRLIDLDILLYEDHLRNIKQAGDPSSTGCTREPFVLAPLAETCSGHTPPEIRAGSFQDLLVRSGNRGDRGNILTADQGKNGMNLVKHYFSST
jgi:7,8-dihydro-6-hydroxymethylpterin-pyrophosphokinase